MSFFSKTTCFNQGSSRSLACLWYHSERHVQSLGEKSEIALSMLADSLFHIDHMAGGRQTAQQQQHGDHAHWQQEVLPSNFLDPCFDFQSPVTWRLEEMWNGRKVRRLPGSTGSSSWRPRPRPPPTWRRPSSTPPGRSTTRSRRASSTSTTRRTESNLDPSTVLQEEQLLVREVKLGARVVAASWILSNLFTVISTLLLDLGPRPVIQLCLLS